MLYKKTPPVCRSKFKYPCSYYTKKMYIHIQSYNTGLYNRSIINMGTKLYNKLPGYIKEIDSYKTFKNELKSLLLLHSFYSVEEFVAL